MATITLTRGTTLPDSASKTDFHNLIDTATGTLSGGITTADISASAGIVGTQLSASAAIAPTQLAQITTASKVHGTSITGLASLPAGAGVIPVANLGSGTPDGTKFLKDDGSFSAVTHTAANSLSGSVVQTVTTNSVAYASLGSTAMPMDDSIPQITEGNAISALDTAITPNNASNVLIIEALCQISNSSNATPCILALFQDSTANALAASMWLGNQTTPWAVTLRWKMAAGTTSATTFKLRAGDNGGGTFHLNGTADAGARKLGGVLVSSLTIREIKA